MRRINVRTVLGLAVSAALAVAMYAGPSAAAEVTLYPSSLDIQGGAVVGDSTAHAPGFGNGSFEANGQTATQIMLPASQLFGSAPVTIGELQSLSYWTNGPAVTGSTPADWYLTVYTSKVPGEASDGSWYGHRLTLEPYFSQNLDAPANQWVQWSTSGDANGDNQLRVYDSFRGASGPQYGTYTDPFLSDLTAGPINWSDYSNLYQNAEFDYTDDPIEVIAISTGSGWAQGFDGLVDGFNVAWSGANGLPMSTDVNLEASAAAVPEPQHDLWLFSGGLGLLLALGAVGRRRSPGEAR